MLVFRTEMESLGEALEDDLRDVAAVRDEALATALETYRTLVNSIESERQAGLDSARAGYATTLEQAVTDRDAAVADARAAYEDGVALAEAAYAAGADDENQTAPFAPADDPAYLAALADAQAAYDSAVSAALAAHQTAVAEARGQLEAWVQQINNDADTALAGARDQYEIDVDAADAAYQIQMDGARSAHDTAVAAANESYRDALDSAQSAYETALKASNFAYDTAVDSAEQDYSDAMETARLTYDNDLADAQATYDAAVADADALLQADLLAAQLAYESSLTAAVGSLDDAVVQADRGFLADYAAAVAKRDGTAQSDSSESEEGDDDDGEETPPTLLDVWSNYNDTVWAALVANREADQTAENAFNDARQAAHNDFYAAALAARDQFQTIVLGAAQVRTAALQEANAELLEVWRKHGKKSAAAILDGEETAVNPAILIASPTTALAIFALDSVQRKTNQSLGEYMMAQREFALTEERAELAYVETIYGTGQSQPAVTDPLPEEPWTVYAPYVAYKAVVHEARIGEAVAVATARQDLTIARVDNELTHAETYYPAQQEYFNARYDILATFESEQAVADAGRSKAIAAGFAEFGDDVAAASLTMNLSANQALRDFEGREIDAAIGQMADEATAAADLRGAQHAATQTFKADLEAASTAWIDAQQIAGETYQLETAQAGHDWQIAVAAADAQFVVDAADAGLTHTQNVTAARQALAADTTDAMVDWTGDMWGTATPGLLSRAQFATVTAAADADLAAFEAGAARSLREDAATARSEAVQRWDDEEATNFSQLKADILALKETFDAQSADAEQTLQDALAVAQQAFRGLEAAARDSSETARAGTQQSLTLDVTEALADYRSGSELLVRDFLAAGEDAGLVFTQSLSDAAQGLVGNLVTAESAFQDAVQAAHAQRHDAELTAADQRHSDGETAFATQAGEEQTYTRTLRGSLADLQKALQDELDSKQYEQAVEAGAADLARSDALSDAMAQHIAARADAEADYNQGVQTAMTTAMLQILRGRLDALKDIAGAGIRVDLAKAMAAADARHAVNQSQIDAIKKIAEAQRALAAAEGQNNLLDFAHIEPKEVATSRWNKFKLFEFRIQAEDGTWHQYKMTAGDVATFGYGVVDGLTGGILSDVADGVGFEWDVIDKTSPYYTAGYIAGTAALIALSFIAPGACGMVGVGLRSFVLTVDIYSAVKGATNIAQDWASGNLGWHNTMDALAILPVLSYGAGRLMRGGPACFVAGTGVWLELGSGLDF